MKLNTFIELNLGLRIEKIYFYLICKRAATALWMGLFATSAHALLHYPSTAGPSLTILKVPLLSNVILPGAVNQVEGRRGDGIGEERALASHLHII